MAEEHGGRRWQWIGAAVVFALMAVAPALAQQGAIPSDAAAAIDAAVRADQGFAANAVITGAIASHSAPATAIQGARRRAGSATISSAVIDSISRYPGSVYPIVRYAVQVAPGERDVIARSASHAFPGFAGPIAAAAGVAGATATPPVRVSGPASPALAVPPRDIRQPDQEVSLQSAFGVSEVWFGVAHHDTGVFGSKKENSDVDLTAGVRFTPLHGALFDAIGSPRPHVGVTFNTSDDTSSFYTGLTFEWRFWQRLFFSLDLGGAIHDGELGMADLDKKELGCRLLFREAAQLGFLADEHHALSLRLEHISNASLCSENEGLDTVGVIYGYRF